MPAEKREGYLVGACGKDLALRSKVEALLKADAEAGGFMAAPTAGAAQQGTAPSQEQPGAQIGRYKLLEKIGEGGFGEVWMAEQREPVKRRVALKIIKLGMDTKQVIARFEAERQALAMMDHPHIAKVLDAGATEKGRPYFVMELVKGHPDPRILRQGAARHQDAPRALHPRLPRDPARAPEGHHPPRHQALERARDAARRHCDSESDRLRHRQGHEQRADEQDALHRAPPGDRHAGLHVARAGGDVGPRHRHAQRHLLARRAALRAAHRHDALPQGHPGRGPRRDAAHDPRGRAAQAQPAHLDHGRHRGAHGAAAASRREEARVASCAATSTGS